MEIISYVREGTIEHKDSMGNIERLEVSNQLADNRIAYLHVVSGELALNGTPLSEGDGATVEGSPVNLTGLANAEALLFDLPPMQRHRR